MRHFVANLCFTVNQWTYVLHLVFSYYYCYYSSHKADMRGLIVIRDNTSAKLGETGMATEWQRQRQDDEDGDEKENSFDICLSQLTCKIFETGTNANSADLLAPKNPEGFSSELTLTMVGCSEQGEYTVWALNGTMCVRAKQGAVKWRLRTLQAACHCAELSWASAVSQCKADHHHHQWSDHTALTGCRAVLNIKMKFKLEI